MALAGSTYKVINKYLVKVHLADHGYVSSTAAAQILARFLGDQRVIGVLVLFIPASYPCATISLSTPHDANGDGQWPDRSCAIAAISMHKRALWHAAVRDHSRHQAELNGGTITKWVGRSEGQHAHAALVAVPLVRQLQSDLACRLCVRSAS